MNWRSHTGHECWGSQTGHPWIETDRIHGRPVFDHDGVLMGKISRLLIDRQSGRVEEVVVHVNGHFGFGQKDVEILWDALRYDTRLTGYRAGVRFTDVIPGTLSPPS